MPARTTQYQLPVQIIAEYAWHALFVKQLFVRVPAEKLAAHKPEFTVIAAPEFEAVPERDGTHSEHFIITDFTRSIILIGGTKYAGEMKKSIFGVMNFLLPGRDVFPMHCSANMGKAGDTALFFGLSGTGKTTLSADPQRAAHRGRRAWLEPERRLQLRRRLLRQVHRSVAENEPQICQRAALRSGARERGARSSKPRHRITTTSGRPRTRALRIRWSTSIRR